MTVSIYSTNIEGYFASGSLLGIRDKNGENNQQIHALVEL
jgi:hypothetical protein